MNEITVQIYASGTTPIYDPIGDLVNISSIWYETGYPGGRYLAGGCYIPRVPQAWWDIDAPLRVVIRSSHVIVFEGVIADFQHSMTPSDMGIYLNFVGQWAWMAQNRSWRKRWADTRVDDQTWEWITGISNDEVYMISRESRLRFLPKTSLIADDDYGAVIYTMPSGSVERIVFDYELTGDAGEDWTAILYDVDNTSTEWSVNQAGGGTSSGSVDLDSTNDYTATTQFEIRFQNTAGGIVEPTSNGSAYLSITNLIVYGEDETGDSININNVATDIIAEFSTSLNADTTYLKATNVRAVEPFITQSDGYKSLGDILFRIADFGDTNDARYAVGLLHSEKAATPDGLPVLFTEDWPDVSAGYDYFISLDDPKVVGSVDITRAYDRIVNDVTVNYRNERGWQLHVSATSATASGSDGLTDATSITTYGQRDLPGGLRIGNSTEANAIDYGTRFIQKHKDPPWIVNGTIGVLYELEGANGEPIPASRIHAGQRLKIDGYDTHVISRTRYDANKEVVEITLGTPTDIIANETVFAPTWDDPVPGEGGSTAGGSGGGGGHDNSDLVGMRGLKRNNPEEWKRRKADMMKYGRENKFEKHWRKNWARDRGYM